MEVDAERLLVTQVPPTLTGVLQARLDGLPAAEKRALQQASVVGAVFWDQALAAIDDAGGRAAAGAGAARADVAAHRRARRRPARVRLPPSACCTR